MQSLNSSCRKESHEWWHGMPSKTWCSINKKKQKQVAEKYVLLPFMGKCVCVCVCTHCTGWDVCLCEKTTRYLTGRDSGPEAWGHLLCNGSLYIPDEF